MPIVAIGKPLREKLGDEAVDSLVDLIKQAQADQKNDVLEFVEEKFERRLSEEFGKMDIKISKVESKNSETKAELISIVSETKAELISIISETKTELMTKTSETKADLIKWMFIFWVGQLGMMLGILFAFFK